MSKAHKEQEALADQMMKQGIKALGVLTTFSQRTKFEDAVVCFSTSANAYVGIGKCECVSARGWRVRLL